MDLITGGATYVLAFLVVLSIVVFVHEYGHYWVARRNGVHVDAFSIGFGPELFGWSDNSGTRWKVAAVPLGGYVKMRGDADPASATADAATATAPDSFPAKSVRQRMAIVAAGPGANFLFAVVALALLLATAGRPVLLPVVGEVRDGTPAAEANLAEGDRITAIDGEPVATFAELQQEVGDTAEELTLTVERDSRDFEVLLTPRMERVGEGADAVERPLIGIVAAPPAFERVNPVMAPVLATTQVGSMIGDILGAVGQIVVGQRSMEELGGPLKIAQVSGDAARAGAAEFTWLMIVLSVNLGLINLFPIPMLDGGHLVMYGIEAARGRPIGERAQELAFRFGLALVLALMVVVTWNDIMSLMPGG